MRRIFLLFCLVHFLNWTAEAAFIGPVGGNGNGSATNLTPWTSDINGAQFSLTNAGTVKGTNFTATGTGAGIFTANEPNGGFFQLFPTGSNALLTVSGTNGAGSRATNNFIFTGQGNQTNATTFQAATIVSGGNVYAGGLFSGNLLGAVDLNAGLINDGHAAFTYLTTQTSTASNGLSADQTEWIIMPTNNSLADQVLTSSGVSGNTNYTKWKSASGGGGTFVVGGGIAAFGLSSSVYFGNLLSGNVNGSTETSVRSIGPHGASTLKYLSIWIRPVSQNTNVTANVYTNGVIASPLTVNVASGGASATLTATTVADVAIPADCLLTVGFSGNNGTTTTMASTWAVGITTP